MRRGTGSSRVVGSSRNSTPDNASRTARFPAAESFRRNSVASACAASESPMNISASNTRSLLSHRAARCVRCVRIHLAPWEKQLAVPNLPGSSHPTQFSAPFPSCFALTFQSLRDFPQFLRAAQAPNPSAIKHLAATRCLVTALHDIGQACRDGVETTAHRSSCETQAREYHAGKWHEPRGIIA